MSNADRHLYVQRFKQRAGISKRDRHEASVSETSAIHVGHSCVVVDDHDNLAAVWGPVFALSADCNSRGFCNMSLWEAPGASRQH